MKEPSNRTGNKQEKKQVVETLEEVANRFAHFRQTHQKGKRIPQELRASVGKLIEEGISIKEVLAACGLSLWQFRRWHKSERGRLKKQKGAPRESAVSVFPVVNENNRNSDDNQELELRLGPWSVSIKLARSAKSAERSPACSQ